MLHADLFIVWFRLFHPTEGTIFTIYIFGFCTEGCVHIGMPSHTKLLHRDAFHKDMFWHTYLVLSQTNAFMHRCFYSGMLLPAGDFSHKRAGISTHRCPQAAMLVHWNAYNAFTRGFFWHRVAFTFRSFCRNTLHAFVQRCLLHTAFCTKRCFLHSLFAEICFYTWVLLDEDTFGQRNSSMGEANHVSIPSHFYVYTQKKLAEGCLYAHVL